MNLANGINPPIDTNLVVAEDDVSRPDDSLEDRTGGRRTVAEEGAGLLLEPPGQRLLQPEVVQAGAVEVARAGHTQPGGPHEPLDLI